MITEENSKGWVLGLALDQKVPVSQGPLVFFQKKSRKNTREELLWVVQGSIKVVFLPVFEDAGWKQC